MMKMMNLRSLDPAYTAQGKVGMQSGGALEKVVWADYEGRRADLKADADQIRQAVAEASEIAFVKLPEAPPYEGEEGGVVMRLHKRYERDPKLVVEKRKAAAATGNLACEVCGFDFKAPYGELGERYIEVHHTKPVNTILAGTKTKLSDLALFCANYNRMAHKKRQPLSVDAIRLALL
jgi:5-methylcytosine-specific restriction protein A